MNQKEALEAAAWLETLRGKEQNVNTAKKLLADHKSSCKHWSTSIRTCPMDGSSTICEWCGEEQ
jgi:predicted house-cleaning NTP pyrophosphatase (Maf/HAM1 superfamily)